MVYLRFCFFVFYQSFRKKDMYEAGFQATMVIVLTLIFLFMWIVLILQKVGWVSDRISQYKGYFVILCSLLLGIAYFLIHRYKLDKKIYEEFETHALNRRKNHLICKVIVATCFLGFLITATIFKYV